MIIRDFNLVKDREFDIVIVGGGVTGCGIALDAVLRGLSVCIIEKNDIGCGTSAATSKLIHGGLRYLKNAEILVVRDCLKERRYLENNAPHLVKPLSFLMTIYKDHGPSRALMGFGFWLYQMLAYDRNWISDKDQRLPSAKWHSRKKMLGKEPKLEPENFVGAYEYYDCANLRPNRLTLEFALSAVTEGAVCLNHTRVTAPLLNEHNVVGVEVRDELTGELHDIKGKLVINAGGPWVDEVVQILGGLQKIKVQKAIGIHLITPQLISQTESTLAFTTHDEHHFFLIPWRGHNIIGTTDMPYEGDMEDLRLTDELIDDFIEMVQKEAPKLGLERSKIVHAYIGARPLLFQEGEDSYEASRKHEIFDHKKLGGRDGVMTVLGGKYTTARSLGKAVVDQALKKMKMARRKSRSRGYIMVSGGTGNVRQYKVAAKAANQDISEAVIDNLVDLFGTKYQDVLAYGRRDTRLLKPIADSSTHPDILAEIHYAVEKESARSLSDMIHRRLEIGSLGNPGDDYLEAVAEEMGELLDWDSSYRREQIEKTKAAFPLEYLDLSH